MKKLTNFDIVSILTAIRICKKYNEDYAAFALEDIVNEYTNAENPKKPEIMSKEEADILSSAITICDRVGQYGAGDLLLDAINNHTKKED